MVIHKPCTYFVDTEYMGGSVLAPSGFFQRGLHRDDDEREIGESRFVSGVCFHAMKSVNGYLAYKKVVCRLPFLRCHP